MTKGRKPYSLRLQLIALVSVPIILAGAVVGALALYATYHEIDEIYDVQLVHAAKLLLDLATDDPDGSAQRRPVREESPGLSHYYEEKISYRIWRDERLIAESLSAGNLVGVAAPPGFSRVTVDGTDWHFFVYVDDATGITVEVAENAGVRTELILKLLGSLVIPALIFVPIILLLVWVGVTRALQPMLAMAREVNRRESAELAPLEPERLPREVMPFIAALNRLFARVDDALRREREFTDNAAHELRTPLAAMKTQIQVLQRRTEEGPALRDGLADLLGAANRANRTVEQLLAFARLQNLQEVAAPVDLSELVKEVLREASPLAVARGQELVTDVAPRMTLTGVATALRLLVRNLVENAIKYTPAGGAITVILEPDAGGRIRLSVSDTGPGIPAEHLDRIFDRFFRIERSGEMGSGLGLAMVRWVADLHRADIEVANRDGKGLTVWVTFPQNALSRERAANP